jgi:hypothetical protein
LLLLLLLLLREFERLLRIIPKNAVFSATTAAHRRPSSRGTEGRVVGAYDVGGSRYVGQHPRQQRRLLLLRE